MWQKFGDRSMFGKVAVVPLAALLLLFIALSSQAEEIGESVTFQGEIMEQLAGKVVVQEKTVFLTKNTMIFVEEEKPGSVRDLVPGQWVLVHAVRTERGLEAKAIFLLPGRIEL